jgi:hypothetical protein
LLASAKTSLRTRGDWLLAAIFAVGLALVPSPADAQRRRTGWLRIVSSTAGATVTIDGAQVGVVPVADPIEIRPGEHTLQVSKRGYTSYNEEIRVPAGQTRDLEVDLLPLSGFLKVRSTQPDVRVFVDGNFIGNAPLEFDLPPGAHSIRASRPGYRDLLRHVDAEAGSEIDIAVALEALPADQNPYAARPARPARWYEKSWVWITVGATVVAVTAATVGVLIATSSESEIDAFCGGSPPCVARVDFR